MALGPQAVISIRYAGSSGSSVLSGQIVYCTGRGLLYFSLVLALEPLSSA